MPTNTHRFFIGLPVSKEVFAYLVEKLESVLSQEQLVQGRLTRIMNAHITVRFLGNVDESEVLAMWKALSHRLAAIRSFELSLIEVSSFPVSTSTLVAAMVAENRTLTQVFEIVQSSVQMCGGFQEKKSPFRPHITLFRCGDRSLALPQMPVKLALPIEKIVLYQSLMVDKKRVYAPIKTLCLKQDGQK